MRRRAWAPPTYKAASQALTKLRRAGRPRRTRRFWQDTYYAMISISIICRVLYCPVRASMIAAKLPNSFFSPSAFYTRDRTDRTRQRLPY
jgi:hypothetical protein